MADFVKVASLDSVSGDGKWMFEISDRLVVLFRVDGQFFCLDDVCTHDGGPLGEGQLEGHLIACPRHGAKFDVRNGHACTMPATEATVAHDVKVDGAFVWVRLRGGDDNETQSAAGQTTAGQSAVNASAAGESSAKECCDGHSGLHAAAHGIAPGVGQANPGTIVALDSAAGTTAVVLCEDLVREELKRVIDPELFVNIVDLGLVYNVDLVPGEVGGSKVKIDMTMTSPMCPAGPQLIAQCKQFVGQLSGVDSVEVKIVMDPPWTPAKMSDSARDQLGIF
jgi:metal-sulfur cluster biosynthetic enzyme/nitrite reductase/ring-hydroxylating ferredoxin subunit